MKLLITGGMGLLGTNWALAVRDRWNVVLGVHRQGHVIAKCENFTLNMTDVPLLDRQIAEVSPDVIVHAAGLSNVEACESERERAYESNVTIAANVARAAAKAKIRLVHISTDHFFDNPDRCALEGDSPTLLNEYARTKWLAEGEVARANPDALIVRSNFFGWGHFGRVSLSDWILKSLRSGQTIQAFEDVWFTPILIEKMAHIVMRLTAMPVSGILHVVGDEAISKLEFARKLAAAFELNDALIQPASIASASLRAPRPRHMALDNSKLRALVGSVGDIAAFAGRLREQEQLSEADVSP